MEDKELLNMWRAYDARIEEARVLNLQSWAVNLQAFEMLQKQKAQRKLRPLATIKKTGIALGLVWAAFLGTLVYASNLQNIYFTVSLAMIMLFTIVAIATYIKHVVLINKVNYGDSVVDAQKTLSELQSSTINVTRFLWLQLPFYCTFFWSNKWIIASGASFWLIAFPVALAFTLLAIWLYININYKNANKKWFKVLFGGKEWSSVVKAIACLDEIENFKKAL